MRLLIDINVIVDLALARAPWASEAAALLAAVEEERAEGWVSAHTVTTLFSLVARAQGRQAAERAVADLLRLVRVVPLGDRDFQEALILGLADFEDAVQAAAALHVSADYLVTRNPADFRGIPTPVRSAGEIVALL